MNYDNEIEKLATALADEAMDKSATYNTAIDMVSDLTYYDDLIVIAEGMIKERAFASVIDHANNGITAVELPWLHGLSGDTI